MITTIYDFERLGYTFRYFFNAGVNDEGFADVEGYDVFQGERYIACLPFLAKEDVAQMTDEELKNIIKENRMKAMTCEQLIPILQQMPKDAVIKFNNEYEGVYEAITDANYLEKDNIISLESNL